MVENIGGGEASPLTRCRRRRREVIGCEGSCPPTRMKSLPMIYAVVRARSIQLSVIMQSGAKGWSPGVTLAFKVHIISCKTFRLSAVMDRPD